MHIAIDISSLQNEHSIRGTGSYTRLLIDSLQKYIKHQSFTLFTRGQKIPKYIDLIHYPYFDPFYLTLPLIKEKPTVVTVHDLIPMEFPEHFPRGMRGALKWLVQKRSLLLSKAVITDSNASRESINRITGILLRKIYVVPLAVNEIYWKSLSEYERLSVIKRYKLPERYILYVGDVNWNKNILGLLRAFQQIHKLDQDLFLILVGNSFLNKSIDEVKEIYQVIEDLNLRDSIIFPGYIAEADLNAIYSSAQLYIQISYAEGFGLPVIEAMASGCPTVVSNNTSLMEIAGPSIIVNPYEIESIVNGIRQALGINRVKFIEAGRKWVKKYNSKRFALENMKVYEKILAK